MLPFKMKLFHILLAILVTFTSILAYPQPHVITNRTVTRLQNRLAVDLPSGRSQWPTSEDHITHICYCWSDQDSAFHLEDKVDDAIKQLVFQLGGPASAISGHSLEIQVFRIGSSEPFCWDDFEEKKWNPDVPRECVAITEAESDWSEGTLGRADGPYNDDQIQFNNYNNLNILEDADMGTILHELGHVLGFTHEHQRSDRDNYIYFSCKAARGYDAMKKIADAQTPNWNMDILCSSADAASDDRRKMVFEFWKSIDSLKQEFSNTPRSELDFESIMIYSSSEYSKDVRKCESEQNIDWCPLMKYLDPESRRGPTAPMEFFDVKPDYDRFLSELDIIAYKEYYPWTS